MTTFTYNTYLPFQPSLHLKLTLVGGMIQNVATFVFKNLGWCRHDIIFWVCKRSNSTGHHLIVSTKFGVFSIPWKSEVILLHINSWQHFFHIRPETSGNGYGNDNISILTTHSCSGKFTYALLDMRKAWRHRSGTRACRQTSPKAWHVCEGRRFWTCAVYFTVSSNLQS